MPRDWIQRAFDRLGRGLDDTALEFTSPDGRRWVIGDGEPRASIALEDAAVLRRILRDPLLAFGESYVDGQWEPANGDLLGVLEACHRLQASWAMGQRRSPWQILAATLAQLNDITRARRNVTHHYDLGYRLYEAFLDDDLHYSCAYYQAPGDTLEAAQQAKCGHIAAKLDLKPGSRVLDIGCGFASFAMYMAGRSDVHVTGITLSRDQIEVGRRRIRERGLEDRVELRLQDYRQVQGQYDAIVSIGMFEHVGAPFYRRFFNRMRELLKPDGTALLHTIGTVTPPGPVNPWIRKYIFPGGHLPSASQLTNAIEHARLVLCDLEVWRRHYAMTLAEWNRRFQAAWNGLSDAYDERFRRMWTFYLTASEAAFRWKNLVVYQAQLARSLDRLPVTRNYLYR